jgi:hypothetical protein
MRRAAVERLRQLLAAHAESPPWLRDLALARHACGRSLTSLGRTDAARVDFEASVAALERALALAPDSEAWRQDLAALRSWLA